MKSNELREGERFFSEERTAVFRKEEYRYVHTGIIDKDGEMWTTTELDEVNLFQIYNQYRAKHGIPFPEEISGLRLHYGLSAAKMSQILGLGINQYRLYEDGEVPSLSNARTIMAAFEKNTMLSFIEASKEEFSAAEYHRVKSKIENAPGNFSLPGRPSIYNGYRTLSLAKITSLVKYLVLRIGSTFVTKMNKLLFYADFLHYKHHGFGITGLSYKALKLGPVPDSWGKVYSSLKDIEMMEYIYPSGQSGIILNATGDYDDDSLTEQETETADRICQLFAEMSAGEVSEISHKEKGWIDNHFSHSLISYQSAFALNYN